MCSSSEHPFEITSSEGSCEPHAGSSCKAGWLRAGRERGTLTILPARDHDRGRGHRSGVPGSSYGDGVWNPNRAQGADGLRPGGLGEVRELLHAGT